MPFSHTPHCFNAFIKNGFCGEDRIFPDLILGIVCYFVNFFIRSQSCTRKKQNRAAPQRNPISHEVARAALDIFRRGTQIGEETLVVAVDEPVKIPQLSTFSSELYGE